MSLLERGKQTIPSIEFESHEARGETFELPKPGTKEQREISPEARRKALEVIFETLDIDPESDIDIKDFPAQLQSAIESLPRYKELEDNLNSVSDRDFSYELFKSIRHAADKEVALADKNQPTDGVLIKSIKASGALECAGRTMIASTLLQKRGIDHSIIQAPGHSFMLVEQDFDTLVYADPNNDLYFTFPKEALKGYQGAGKTAEGKLEPYIPREKDIVDGVNIPFDEFFTMPPSEGIARQYLGNVSAALAGREEFKQSNIIEDQEAVDAVHDFERELLGAKDKKFEDFQDHTEENLHRLNVRSDAYRRGIVDLFKTFPGKDEFVQAFSSVVRGGLGENLPYLKNASDDKRREYGEKLWDSIQRPEILEQISRMQ